MAESLSDKRIGFGTMPVFLTTICTILGTILFLRMGYAVAHVGFWGALGIIIIGHLVTIPAALAVSEIATNQKVEGGGAYHIVSRSFGLTIGGTIGIALYLSQAISVAFYVIAFSEAFSPILTYLQETYEWTFIDKRMISIPTMILLSLLMLLRGANVGMKALYGVAFILFASIALIFAGGTSYNPESWQFLNNTIQNGDRFFYVFTIIFPAFTGIIVGLGLSGDLKNPKKSIPLGTLSATLIGMVVYIAISYKLATSATPTSSPTRTAGRL
jgi:amino acid transporter